MARIHVEVQKRIIFVVVVFESELFYARRQRETQNRSAWLKPAPGVRVNHITLPGAVLCLGAPSWNIPSKVLLPSSGEGPGDQRQAAECVWESGIHTQLGRASPLFFPPQV